VWPHELTQAQSQLHYCPDKSELQNKLP